MVPNRWPILAVLTVSLAAPAAADDTFVYHYDPDSAPHNAGKLKAVVGAFLGGVDATFRFQPFRARVDLEREMERQPPGFLLVSADFLDANRERLDLRPLLVPTREGKDTFRKVLLTRGTGTTLASLAGRSLAATGIGTSEAFASLLGPLGTKPRDIRVVTVSKDVDALLALALGQVDLALVRPESVERVGKANPAAVAGLVTLHTTQPLRLPRLCQRGEQPSRYRERLVRGLKDANGTPLGRRAMRILGFDGWVDAKEAKRP